MGNANDVNKKLQDMTESVEALKLNRDALLAQLECPVCRGTCLPPIFMCKNGHNLCNTCRQQVQECPICREPGRPDIKNMFAESFSKQFTVDCKFKEYGCQGVVLRNKLDVHVLYCPYRFRCWGGGYQGRDPWLIEHVATRHPAGQTVGSEYEGVIQGASDTIRTLACHDKLFGWSVKTHENGLRLNTWYTELWFKTADIYCWFEFSSEDGALKYNYRVPCIPTDKVIKDVDCVFVSPDEVKRFRRRDGSMMCQVRIE